MKELNEHIKAKWGLEPAKITRVVHRLQNGLELEMDDKDVQELKEGQTMILEIDDLAEKPLPARREWEMAVDTADVKLPFPDGYVLHLNF